MAGGDVGAIGDVAGLISIVVLAGGAPAASAEDATYGSRLVGPNTAVTTVSDEHHQAGDYIGVTGSGTFDLSSGAVDAGGAWTHFNVDGTVHMAEVGRALPEADLDAVRGL